MARGRRSPYTSRVKRLLPILICGCFKLPQDLADSSAEMIPFDNPHVMVDDAVQAMRETAADRRRPRDSMLADTSTLELDICWKIQ